MQRLTEAEEIRLLNQVKNCDPLDFGSSRAVFSLFKELPQPKEPQPDLVLKVAFDEGGQTQNKTEVEVFAKYGYDSPLVPIVAYGKYVVVMYEVYPLYCDEWKEFSRKQLGEFNEIVNFLDDELGQTGDNKQVGYLNGELYAYDYGLRDEIAEYSISFDMFDNMEFLGSKKMINKLLDFFPEM